MRLLAAAVLLLSTVAHADDAVVIFTDRNEPPRKITAGTLQDVKAEIATVWVWSDAVPPRRTDAAGAAPALKRSAEGKLEVRVDRQRLPKETRLRLIAAPQQAWEEVPEDFLPSWVVTAGESVTVPVDRGATWRVRLAGPGFGTWWTDVPPGRGAVVLSPIEAADRTIRFETEKGRPLAAARLSLLDEAAERGKFAKLADYRSEPKNGRVVIAALPDTAKLTLVGSAFDRAPHVAEARPSAFPERMVIHPGAVVRSRLVDRDGKPIPGAETGVRTWVAETLSVPLLRTATTKADGTGEVTALPAGRAEWRATAPGYAPASRPLRLALDGAIDLGTIVLEPAGAIAVRVRDDRGEPVRASIAVNDGTAVTANAKGEATLPVIAGQPFEIAAAAPLHRRVTREVHAPFPPVVELELTRAFRVTGRIVDANGAGIPQATIRAIQGTSFSNHEGGPDGRFEIELDPGLEHRLEIRSPTTALVQREVAAGSPGEQRELGDVTAPAGLVVTGRLVRAGDRTSVAGARIWLPRPSEAGPLMAWAFRDVLQTESGADGTFELRGLPATPVTVRIDAPSLAPARQRVTPEAGAARVDLGEIALAAGATVSVILEGDSGDGATARVDLGGSGMPMDLLSAAFTNGRAIVPAVPAGAVMVSAARGKETLCRQQATVPADVSEFQVVCRARMVRVEGSVTVGGRPAALGTVVLVPPLDDGVATGIFESGRGGYRQQQVFSSGSGGHSAEVGHDGRFTFARVLPGAWEVFWMPERGRALAPRRVEIPAADVHPLALQYPGIALRGTVVDAEQRPVADADVRDMRGEAFARTAPDGTFVLAGPAAGTWQVQARHRDRRSRVVTVEVREDRLPEPLALVLEPSADVVRANVPAGSLLFVETQPGALRIANADANGVAELRFQHPLPTRIRIAAAVGGALLLGEWTPFDAAVSDGLTLQPGPTGTLHVRTKERSGSVTIASGSGWRVDRLLQWLGAFPSVTPEVPLTLQLPAGTYEVTFGNQTRVVSVERDRAREATFD
ncbi:MAG TPA: carboxypeptidase-like regulatory domain-containing protein [Thermoanaerobaculia bacterium]|nr:carboxypeptidase-like regulatory domain-containing protein [Thermoanaerobaculia bacterium]